MRNEALMPNLKRKDELIASLKKVLLDREKRIGELEVALAERSEAVAGPLAEIRRVSDVTPHVETAENESADVTERTKQASSRARLGEVLDLDSCSGVYDDRWTGMDAILAIRPDLAGREAVISFYLPPSDAPAKVISVNVGSGTSHEIQLARDHTVSFEFQVPSDQGNSPFGLMLSIDTPEPASAGDHRSIGVFLLSASAK